MRVVLISVIGGYQYKSGLNLPNAELKLVLLSCAW